MLDADNVEKAKRQHSKELTTSIGSGCDASKPIKVQLPLEGRQPRLLKVLGHDLRSESIGIVDSKGTTVGAHFAVVVAMLLHWSIESKDE